MKAIVNEKFGSPAVLRLAEIAQPVPAEDEVLVQVVAVALNPRDWHLMRGTPVLMRAALGWFSPKEKILGSDISGRVVAVGAKVSRFKPGDEVFGDLYAKGLAEFALAKEDQLVAKPANASFAEAACLGIAPITALQSLRDKGQIQAGQSVLVNGASGGVGSFALQIAKYYGAVVTGVCSGRNIELVKSLGADRAIDYQSGGLAEISQAYDLVFDTVGNLAIGDYRRLLRDPGIAAVVGFQSMSQVFRVMRQKNRGTQKIYLVDAKTNQGDLEFLGGLFEAGKLKASIDRSYPMEKTAEAMAYLETGRVRGKVVVMVGE